MAVINRSFKLRIYPTPEQQVFLNRTLGCARFIYNQMLAERIRVYEELKDDKEALYSYKYKTDHEYKLEFEFLKEVDSQALCQARGNLEKAYREFFKSLKGERKGARVGFPRFKSKHNHNDSYRTYGALSVNFDTQRIRLAKLKTTVRFKHKLTVKSWYRSAKLKNITVSRCASGKYYATCLFEGEQDYTGVPKTVNPEKIIGLDMSLRNFYIDNFGNSPNYQSFYRRYEPILARLQRRMSRKPKGSHNREKARIKVARVHERIANCRRHFIDKLSWQLVRDYDAIVVENLALQGMSQGLYLGKSVMDLGYAEFVHKLKYKALWNDKTVIVADRYFASSKTCSSCGFVKKDLLLSDREWVCPQCGVLHDRDQNAAINLVNLVKTIPMIRGELTSMDTEALTLSNESETAVDEVENLRSKVRKNPKPQDSVFSEGS